MSDRKYKHRGYQDGGAGYSSSNNSSAARPQQGPRTEFPRQRIEGAPRGRTAGGFGPEAFKCNRCGELQNQFGDLTNESICLKCGADLHTCGNCRFFDTTTTWECRAEIPARVPGKHTKNDCTFFAAKIVRDLAADKGGRSIQSPDDARKAFDALFKK